MAYASPATVSRAGMVYVDPKNLGYLPYWQRWLDTRHPDEAKKLDELYVAFIPPCMAFIFDGMDGSNHVDAPKPVIVQTNLNMITQLCHMFDAMLPIEEANAEDDVDEVVEQSGKHIKLNVEEGKEINTDVIAATFLMVSAPCRTHGQRYKS